ncbi:MAG: BREX-1 system adenine-specific DNA-methyltransferase PglX, partial [candidate division KSB1 bacterium]|nr:BREX-1 system adenine-specific DNA-methyltransferase PglX [candidate division KSB1 bacterium]
MSSLPSSPLPSSISPQSLRIEGGLFSPDLLEALSRADLPGQKPADFGLSPRRALTDEIAAVYHDARALRQVFLHRLERLPEGDPATSETRELWMIPFLRLLGYELQYQPRAVELDGLTFSISHLLSPLPSSPLPSSLLPSSLLPSSPLPSSLSSTPIHIVGCRQELGKTAPSGRPRLSPHALVQEYLNRSEALWGLVTNGRTLRLLRNSTYIRRQAYVEFDLENLFEEERFADFVLLYRLLHRTRLPKDGQPEECLLEQYYQYSLEQGGRVREHLREGVERCLEILANGFLTHPENETLRQTLNTGMQGNSHSPLSPLSPPLSPLKLYQNLLRLVYRFLFLLVSEERGLMGHNPLYLESYGITRLRRLTENRAAYTDDTDLCQGLRALWLIFQKEEWAARLGVPPLNGELFAENELDAALITNRDLLEAFRHLAFYDDPPRRVNYAALDTEELGSVYESLLDYHPTVTFDSLGRPRFELAPGSERKSTGSYYTPPQLVSELIRSALEPVIAERLEEARKGEGRREKGEGRREKGEGRGEKGDAEWEKVNEKAEQRQGTSSFPLPSPFFLEHALLSIKVCDPACGSGHFLLAAARRLGKELARVRTGEDEPAPEQVRLAVRDVVAHCIYGVDKNPLAVELARVALWLESHAEGKPLTFLDHRIKCGDSLVGVLDLNVLQNGIPDEAYKPLSGDDRDTARLAAQSNRNALNRRDQGELAFDADQSFETELEIFALESSELANIPQDSLERVQKMAEIHRGMHGAGSVYDRLKKACDLWTAAFFTPLTPDHRDRIPTSRHLLACLENPRTVDGRVLGWAEALAQENRFFHWPLEFPEVFSPLPSPFSLSDKPGFDVILGNPPFMGGLKISGTFGMKYRRYLEYAYDPFGGTADLCAAFFRRAFSLLKPGGRLGMIATNTLGQGDTRESGLAVILKQNGVIHFAQRFVKWPGQASVEVNLVALSRSPVLHRF